MTISVLRQVTALQEIEGTELRKMWRQYFESDPPTNNRGFLVKRLACRIQELALGGVSPALEERLDALAEGRDDPGKGKATSPDRSSILPGTRLVREWKGVEHCCTVLDDGFEYQGRKFRSLSAVANAITGTRWNGFIFWGVGRRGDKS